MWHPNFLKTTMETLSVHILNESSSTSLVTHAWYDSLCCFLDKWLTTQFHQVAVSSKVFIYVCWIYLLLSKIDFKELTTKAHVYWQKIKAKEVSTGHNDVAHPSGAVGNRSRGLPLITTDLYSCTVMYSYPASSWYPCSQVFSYY